jgi:Cu/Ag efflux pump CusA
MVPLARAVVGGLAVSTLMTLIVVPVLHSLMLAREHHARPAQTVINLPRS